MEKGFTLVIPLYNKEHCIRQTLDSVLNNHGEYPFKCIIIDDDSTDGSSQIAEEYDMKYPDVFQYYKIKHHGNKSPVNARNVGIKIADTKYIGFLDADDEICAGFIDRGCTFLDEHPEYSMYGNGFISYNVKENPDIYTYLTYTSNDVDNFKKYVNSNATNVHFCANIYITEYVKDNLFTDVWGEDTVFRMKYVYKHPNIYVDKDNWFSIMYKPENSESVGWIYQRTDKHWLIEIFDNIKNDLPGFEYQYFINENGEIEIR